MIVHKYPEIIHEDREYYILTKGCDNDSQWKIFLNIIFKLMSCLQDSGSSLSISTVVDLCIQMFSFDALSPIDPHKVNKALNQGFYVFEVVNGKIYKAYSLKPEPNCPDKTNASLHQRLTPNQLFLPN